MSNKAKDIKAILIDVVNQEVREVIVKAEGGHHLNSMYEHLRCDCITSAYYPFFQSTNHACFVDDEGLLLQKKLGAFSFYNASPLSGNGLIVGIDEEGESIDCTLNIALIKGIVAWRNIDDLPEPSITFHPLDF